MAYQKYQSGYIALSTGYGKMKERKKSLPKLEILNIT
jgi:hypothetical protein